MNVVGLPAIALRILLLASHSPQPPQMIPLSQIIAAVPVVVWCLVSLGHNAAFAKWSFEDLNYGDIASVGRSIIALCLERVREMEESIRTDCQGPDAGQKLVMPSP